MAITHLGNNNYEGLTSDTKPTNVPAGALFRDTQLDIIWEFNGTTWDIIFNKALDAAKVSNYLDYTKLPTAAADPPLEEGRTYLRTIDASNNGIFAKHKQAGIIVEEQISPRPLISTYFNDLLDVTLTTPQYNQRPLYDVGTAQWINAPPPPSEDPERKSGEWYPGSTTDIATGLLSVNLGPDIGTVTRGEDSKGRWTQFETLGSLINVGLYQTVARYRMEYGSKIYAYFLSNTGTSNLQLYIGFTSSATLPAGPTPLDASIQGALVVLRLAENATPPGNLYITHNDNTATATYQDTGILYGGSTTYHKVEVHLSSTNVKFYVDNTLVYTATTKIPLAATPLYPYVLVRKPGGGEKSIKIYKVGVISK
jgi:hypothetical protein